MSSVLFNAAWIMLILFIDFLIEHFVYNPVAKTGPAWNCLMQGYIDIRYSERSLATEISYKLQQKINQNKQL